MINNKSKAKFRLLVRKPIIDEDGVVVNSKWFQVNEINIGSVNKPNNEILEIRIEPVDEEHKPQGNPFFGGGFFSG